MSNYLDKPGFLDPKMTQYGNHMVMTNVVKPTKHKFVNIDTKFRDEYNYGQLAYYTVSLPERITDVKSMMVCNAEIPMSFYNVSASLGNNYFQIVKVSDKTTKMIIVPDGQYNSITDLTSRINSVNTTSTFTDISFNYTSPNVTVINNQSTSDYYINFNTDSSGNFDKFNFKSKLGWTLGFRQPSYVIPQSNTSAPVLSNALYDLNGPRYLYLVVDEFSNGNPSSFIVPNYDFLAKANILAKITRNHSTFPFGSVLPANNFNGYLLTDRRRYTGKIDIQRLRVQLVNDLGNPVNLNGQEFSFCLEVEHE